MKRTYKYYLKLTKSEKKELDKQFSNCNFLHNLLLEQFRERDKNKEKQPTEHELVKLLVEIKKNNPYLKITNASVLQNTTKQFYKTWQKHLEFKKLGLQKGYPRFKPIWKYNSFTYCQPIEKSGCGYKLDNYPITKRTETRKLKLALGNQNNHRVYLELKIKMERNFERDAKTLTISRKNNRYYASFTCDNISVKPLSQTNQKVGIDVNLNKQSYITLSNGKKYKHPKFYKKSEQQLIQASKNLSNKVEKSKNWLDAKLQMNKKWEKVVNQFKWNAYQIANELVKKYDKIVIEKLQIKNMVKNHKLAKVISQARWGILFQSIADKVEETGRQFIRVNPHNTSQKCSNCQELAKEKLTLRDRMFQCWSCDYTKDRDENSAINILNLADVGLTETFLERGKEL